MMKYRFHGVVQLLFQKFHLIEISPTHFPSFENNISQMWCVLVINVCVVLIPSYWFIYRMISFGCLELMATKHWVYTVISFGFCKENSWCLLLQYRNNGTMMVHWGGTWPHFDVEICVCGIHFSAAYRPLYGVAVCHKGSE